MENFDIHHYLEILRRRRLSYGITTACLLALTIFVAATWSSYRSTATIQVNPSTIATGMTAPLGMDASQVVQALADQEIQQIQEVVTSTSSLVDVITKFKLYSAALKKIPIADVAIAMRKKILVKILETNFSNAAAQSRPTPGQLSAIAFDVSFTYGDPLTAQKVLNEIVTRFLDEDLRRRHAQTQETIKLLDSQITELENSLAEQEKKVGAFRGRFAESRPESLLVNQQAAMTTYLNLQAVESQLASVEKSRGDLKAELAGVEPYSRVISEGQVLTTPAIQLKALQAKYVTMAGQYGPDHPDVVKLRHQIDALMQNLGSLDPDTALLQAKINDIKTNLAAAEKTYGPDHPDVKSLTRQLDAAEDDLARAPTPTIHQEIKRDADNPAYLMLTAQIHSADQQYQALNIQRDNLKKQYEQYQRNVALTPATEEENARLSRDYDNAQLRYRELKEKRQTAAMNEKMEEDRLDSRLSVVDAPDLPHKTYPSQLILFLAGTMVSIFGGFGGVIGAEMLSRSVHGVRHVTSMVGAPPLVAIPYITTKMERVTLKRRRFQVAGGVAAVILVALVVIDQFVVPLDTLF